MCCKAFYKIIVIRHTWSMIYYTYKYGFCYLRMVTNWNKYMLVSMLLSCNKQYEGSGSWWEGMKPSDRLEMATWSKLWMCLTSRIYASSAGNYFLDSQFKLLQPLSLSYYETALESTILLNIVI